MRLGRLRLVVPIVAALSAGLVAPASVLGLETTATGQALLGTFLKAATGVVGFDGGGVPAFSNTLVTCPVGTAPSCAVEIGVSTQMALTSCEGCDAIRVRVRVFNNTTNAPVAVFPASDITSEPEPNQNFYATRHFTWFAKGLTAGGTYRIEVTVRTLGGSFANLNNRTQAVRLYDEGP